MTNEERDLITRFFARVGGAGQQSGGFLGGAPSAAPPMPPIDREADALIAGQFQQYPEARYRITQTAIVQEAALAESQNRIRRLEWELDQTRQRAQQAQQGGPQSRGFLGNLFGGGQQRPQFQPTMPPPQPQYAPGYQPGMFQQGGGSGFLGSALTTAAGVAGGLVVGNALMSAFEGHHSDGGFAGGGFGGGGFAGGSSPWDSAGTPVSDPTAGFSTPASDPWSGGGASKGFGQDTSQASFDQGYDQSGGGVDTGGGFDGGGFDSGSSDNSSF